jgi:membrane associated rhomboid family serine protease
LFPLRDENPTRSTPWVTNLLLAVNLVVFGYELSLPPEKLDLLFRTWGFVPAEVGPGVAVRDAVRVFTSMFLHGGIFHVGGNMLFLWVFGDNVEDELGHGSFLLFYLLTGVAAVGGQYWAMPESTLPMVGASGAISGILGAYLLLYPSTPVLTAVIIIFIVRLIYLPAWFFLGYWFLIQFLSGMMTVGAQSMGGGTAWFAHIGGFVAGFIWIVLHWIRGGRGR